jgi:hypothetical protein
LVLCSGNNTVRLFYQTNPASVVAGAKTKAIKAQDCGAGSGHNAMLRQGRTLVKKKMLGWICGAEYYCKSDRENITDTIENMHIY